VALDRDLERLGQAGGNRVRAARMGNPPEALVGVGGESVEPPI